MEHYPYWNALGKRHYVESRPLGQLGFGPHVIRTRKTLVIDENLPARVAEFGSSKLLSEVGLPKTQVMVPLIVGDQVRGILQLNDMEREHAFSDSEVRLLETLANSMSIALERAPGSTRCGARARSRRWRRSVARSPARPRDRVATHSPSCEGIAQCREQCDLLPDAGGAHFRAIVAIGEVPTPSAIP
jgi:GAF domain-containing protein